MKLCTSTLRSRASGLLSLVSLLALGFAGGCSKSEDAELGVAKTPKEAASQLESAFRQAPEPARVAAAAAAEAMRQKDYEKAVVSLQTVRATESVSMEQGIAVHGTMVALEGELLSAAQGGDARAKQAYELLKAMKRK